MGVGGWVGGQRLGKLTTHEAAGRSLEDAGAFQALWVGTGGAHARLQQAGRQPAGQPLQLAVTQEAVALDQTGGRGGGGASVRMEITHTHTPSWAQNRTDRLLRFFILLKASGWMERMALSPTFLLDTKHLS